MLTVLLVFTACNRYDEGANFSLLTAKMRLVNTWTMTKISATNGSTTWDVTGAFPATVVNIMKDGTYVTTYTAGNGSSTEKGTWTFNDGKTQAILTEDDGSVRTYNIIKLKNKEMKVTEVDGSTTYTMEFTGE